MQIRSGIRWPVGVDFNQISTPGRISSGSRGKIMLLTKHGCANRPFYHVEVTRVRTCIKLSKYLVTLILGWSQVGK